jgi:hypothetical protein
VGVGVNEKDFELYKEIVLTLLANINLTESKTGYGYHEIVGRIEEYANEVFNILVRARDAGKDNDEEEN